MLISQKKPYCQFKSVFTTETEFKPTQAQPRFPSMPPIHISSSGVLKLLQQLNPTKASGPDNLSPRVLRELSQQIAEPFTIIFQRSLNEGVLPDDWHRANVVPVFKKGQKYLCSNYRPISLTCVISKVMEHIISSNIMSHANTHNILYPLQHGFRSRRSCESQLIEFVHDIVSNMAAGHQTDVCILDFAKAFDKVGHRRLVEKLKWYGIDGAVNTWIESFLSCRTQRVVVEGESSEELEVTSGVPQGSVLGPCLFLYYINDIAEGLSSTVRLFADDTMIYMAIRNDSDAEALQKDLDLLCEWEAKWMMEFHPDKCEILTITRKKSPVIYSYRIHGQQLKHSDQAKYLGVNISSDMRWNKHIDTVTAKANSRLGFVKRNININSRAVKEQAYKSLVRPILEYSQTVWDPYTVTQTQQLESVQRRAARFTMSRYRRTSSVGAMLAELNWEPLASRRRAARLVFFYKVHYELVAVNMPLELKHHPGPTRTENSLAYYIPATSVDYQKNSFFFRTVRDWNYLPEEAVLAATPESFRNYISP